MRTKEKLTSWERTVLFLQDKRPELAKMIALFQSGRVTNSLAREGYNSIEKVLEGLKAGKIYPHAFRNYGEKTHTQIVQKLVKARYLNIGEVEYIQPKLYEYRDYVLADTRELIELYGFTVDELFKPKSPC